LKIGQLLTILEPGTKHRPIGLKKHQFWRPIGLCFVPAANAWKNVIWTSKYSFHRLMYKTKVEGNEKKTCLHPKFLKIGQLLTILEPGTNILKVYKSRRERERDKSRRLWIIRRDLFFGSRKRERECVAQTMVRGVILTYK
jgi:hypothetical protein